MAAGLLGACAVAGPAPNGPGAGPATTAMPPGSAGYGSATSGALAASGSTAPGGRVVSLARGVSTRTRPQALVAGVRPGQTVRVTTFRLSGGVARVDVVRRTGPDRAREAVAAAQADPAELAVGIDHRVHLADEPAAATTYPRPSSWAPPSDDTYRPSQWALAALHAEDVWRSSTGAGQIVAVVDTGVQADHPDLAGRVMSGDDELTAGGTGRTDPNGHGTHVAGIVAALARNHLGIAGLAPQARILPVRVMDASGAGYDGDVSAGITWAADHGATVINLSLGSSDPSDVMRSAIQYAVARGVVVAAAVGNERAKGNPLEYPAGYGLTGLVAVAATTPSGAGYVSASYSNTGPQVMIAAPGSGILSTYPTSTYEYESGTSMATPYVAAAVALVRAAAPALTPAAAVQALVSTADDLEAPGRDDDTGAGQVDPYAALCSVGLCPAASPTATPTSTSPSTSPTSSPSGSPTGSPTSSPTASPTVAPTPLRLVATAPAGVVVSGRATLITVRVTDGAGPVAGVTVGAVSGGRSVSRRTDSTGTARLPIAPPLTATWTVTASAAGRAAVRAAVVVPVAPAVSVRWRGSRVTVTVAPAAGQVVTVWTRGAAGWVRGARHAVRAGAATVTLAVRATGAARVTVTAVGALRAVVADRH